MEPDMEPDMERKLCKFDFSYHGATRLLVRRVVIQRNSEQGHMHIAITATLYVHLCHTPSELHLLKTRLHVMISLISL